LGLCAVLGQGLAQGVDVEAQASLSHDNFAPDSRYQLPIAHDLSGVLCQNAQNVERAVAQLDRDAVSFQEPKICT
jgi:hypothetical protein